MFVFRVKTWEDEKASVHYLLTPNKCLGLLVMGKCPKDVTNNNTCTIGAMYYVCEKCTIILCALSVTMNLVVRT